MMRKYSSHFFVALLLAANLMGSVRYIFRIGEPHTSATYSPIPSAYFIFWDVVIGLLLILIVSKISKLKMIPLNYLSIYVLALMFILICFFQTESFYVHGVARSLILYGFIFLCIASNEDWISIFHLNKAIEFLAVFGLFYLFFQIDSYLFYGVPPAHSNPGASIRYGSFYDDSLVLGALLPMFAGYFFKRYQNIFASLLLAGTFIAVAILTGSMTAIAVMFLYVIWNFRKQCGVLLILCCLGLLFSIYLKDQIIALWLFKAGSIAGHVEGWSHLADLGILTLAGFNPLDIFAESGFLLLLYNFGAPVLIIVLAFHIITLLSCRAVLLESNTSREMSAFVGATEGLTISVLIANFNLPVFIISPVYLFVAIFSAIVIKNRQKLFSEKNGGNINN